MERSSVDPPRSPPVHDSAASHRSGDSCSVSVMHPAVGTPRVSVRDVALEAEVSPATVSRVLNADPDRDTDKARRVRQVAQRLGYVSPRRVSTSRGTLVAIVVTDVRNSYFGEIVRGAERALAASGYACVLFNSDNDRWREGNIAELIANERLAGAVISPASSQGDLAGLVDAGIPVVLVDRRAPGEFDTVVADNWQGGFLATTHLLDLGRRRVACVTGPADTTTGFERRWGWQDAHDRAGVPWDEQFVHVGDFTESDARLGVGEMLERSPRPDAIFAANGPMTLGTLDAIRRAGLTRHDVQVVGYDENSWAKVLDPPLPYVSQPAEQMGLLAGERLLARMQGDRSPARLDVLPTALVTAAAIPPTRRRAAAHEHTTA